MSLRAFRICSDWHSRVDGHRQQERRLVAILALLLGGTTLAMGAVELLRPLLPVLAWRDFWIQALSLGTYLAAAAWFALRYRPEALKVAIAAGLVGWVACALGNVPLKASIPMELGHLKFSDPAMVGSPLLLLGLGFFLVWPWLAWLCGRYPEEMRRAGLVGDRLGEQLLAGILAGVLLCGHIFFTNYYSKVLLLTLRSWMYYFWVASYEFGFQSLVEELIFRGWIFAYLYGARNWGFWKAALFTSALNLLLYLPKREWTETPIIVVGMLFYFFLGGMIYAVLYRRYRSIWPSWLANAILGTFAALLT